MATLAIAGSVSGAAGVFGGASLLTAGLTSVAIGTGVVAGTAFLLPAVTSGPEDIEGPRVKEIDVPQASEGAPINFILGPNNRVGGTIIWVSDLKEHVEIETVDVNKFDEQDLISYSYSIDIAVALGFGEINRIRRIWANGRQLLQDWNPVLDVISVNSTEIEVIYFPPILGILPGRVYVVSSLSGPDLTQFRKGTVSISGFTHSGNNGTLPVLQVGTYEINGVPSGTFLGGIGYGFQTEAKGDSVTINQTDVDIFSPRHVAGIDFYSGDETQVVNSTLNGLFGTKTPAYRGVSYVVLRGLRLEDFGNRIPTLSFEVEEANSRKVSEAIAMILERGGLTSAQYDIDSSLDSVEFKGMVVQGPESPINQLKPIMRAYNLVMQESNGVLKIFPQGNEDVVTINADYLAARESGNESPRKLVITDIAGRALPGEVNVQFLSPEPHVNIQRNSQKFKRIVSATPTTLNIDIPMTLSPSEAKAIAIRELNLAYSHRRTVEFTLPPNYLQLQEQDVVTVDVDGTGYRILITSVTKGGNWLMRVQGLIETAENYDYTPEADEGLIEAPNPIIYTPPELALFVGDTSAIMNSHVGFNGVYAGVQRAFTDAEWSGAYIDVSFEDDDEDDYVTVGYLTHEAVIGRVISGPAPSAPHFWDNDTTIDVEVFPGSPDLVSYSEKFVLAGMNRALIGDEVIAFKTATSLGNNQWRLSGLLRGLRNTEWAIASSETDDIPFILLSASRFTKVPLGGINVGEDVWIRARSIGDDGTRSFPQQITFSGGLARPPQVVNLTAERNEENGNIIISWNHRSAHGFPIIRQFAPPIDGQMGFVVQIKDTANNEYRVTHTNNTTLFYSTDQQAEDGFTSANIIRVNVYEYTTNGPVGLGTEIDIPAVT
jgi:hypothetical protein